MEIRSQKLSDFFNIGRDLGWDVEKQKWTVNQLINPEGIAWTLGDIIDGGFPPETPLIKSGNRYGFPPQRARIADTFRYDLGPENVLITLGTQMSNFIAMTSILEPGDEAIVETPSWEQPRVLGEALKAKVKLLRRRPELNWKFDLDELKGLLTDKTKLIYICHPNNSTGAMLTESELTAICDLARKHGTYGHLRRDLPRDGMERGVVADHRQCLRARRSDRQHFQDPRPQRAPAWDGSRPGTATSSSVAWSLKHYITLHQ